MLVFMVNYLKSGLVGRVGSGWTDRHYLQYTTRVRFEPGLRQLGFEFPNPT